MARRKSPPHESENTDRWMVSYADFVTLLFAFFVVMYAISSINEGKYRVLSDTMTEAFKVSPKSPDPIQVGKEPTAIKANEQGSEIIKPVQILPKPQRTYAREMKQIADTVSKSVQPLIDKGLIKITQHKLWVEIEMNTSILFSSADSELAEEAFPALKALAGVLKTLPNSIDVEGHTDNLPISNDQFPSNWELSAARAASVVHLFTRYGVSPQRLSSIGYAEYRPIADNTTSDGRLRNRRVKVVILADKNARRIAEIDRDVDQAKIEDNGLKSDESNKASVEGGQ
ncbi:MAG: flagellar motor protein MotD [Gammaproteobacteria bacterium]|nr:flagellar motor protein MotD [Gammaproteobacteria bacterium]MCW8987849.1 flagellar motor protein MotD [Gammaproteobacteria bacterium]MCW9032105.1 flagellar motor protein MotD [Gammaproteobacteria bacterium]